MMRRLTRPIVLPLAMLLGCSIVEPNAYLDAAARDANRPPNDASNDSSVMDAGSDAMQTPVPDGGLQLVDTCDGDAPTVLRPGLRPLVVSTIGLSNVFDRRGALQCTGNDAPGNDGFFAIDVQADEKWHFHVTAQDPESNPAIYLLDATCRADQCQQRFGLDLCGTYGDEHFTIIATHAGRWFLGIDDRAPGGHTYRLNAIRTTCGNGLLEHGEACDGADGCDAQCRWQIATGAADVEPNDDWTVANVLTVDRNGGSTHVLGQIGGSCGFDMYAVDVAAGVSLEATLLGRDGQPCAPTCPANDEDAGSGSGCSGHVPIRLELIAPDGATVLGTGSVRSGNQCAVIGASDTFSQSLQGNGLYYLRLWTPENLGLYEYRLQVLLNTP